MYTRLEAINIMLSTIGELPIVNVDETGYSDDSTLAVRILDENNKIVQSIGWHFNIEKNVILHPTTNNEIIIPDDILRVKTNDRDIVTRKRKLYNKRLHTYNFDNDVSAEIVYLLDFEDIPTVAQYYITIKSARVFQARCLGSEILFKYTATEEMEAHRVLRHSEAITGQHNMLRDSISTSAFMDRYHG